MTAASKPAPIFVEVGSRFISVVSIAYVQKAPGMHGTDVFIYLNVSKPDGTLQSIQLQTPEEVEQIGAFVNGNLFDQPPIPS